MCPKLMVILRLEGLKEVMVDAILLLRRAVVPRVRTMLALSSRAANKVVVDIR